MTIKYNGHQCISLDVKENTTVEVDGLGWHDYSSGARDMHQMGRHCWIHGNLPRARSFALTFIEDIIDGNFVRGLEKAVYPFSKLAGGTSV